MSSDQRPWYQWYPKEFNSDEKVRCLTPLAEVVYRRALDLMWESNDIRIPNAMPLLYESLGKGMESHEFEEAWKRIQYPDFELLKVSEDKKWLFSTRLQRQYKDLCNTSEKRQAAGIAGANARWGNRKNRKNGKRMANAWQNDGYSESDSESDKREKPPIVPLTENQKIPIPKIIEAYHSILNSLPAVRTNENGMPKSDTLKTDISARWKDRAEYRQLEFWQSLFEQVLGYPHLMGENDRGWTASLPWIVKKKNFNKILDNFYKTKTARDGPAPSTYAQHQDYEKRQKIKMLRELENGAGEQTNGVERINEAGCGLRVSQGG